MFRVVPIQSPRNRWGWLAWASYSGSTTDPDLSYASWGPSDTLSSVEHTRYVECIAAGSMGTARDRWRRSNLKRSSRGIDQRLQQCSITDPQLWLKKRHKPTSAAWWIGLEMRFPRRPRWGLWFCKVMSAEPPTQTKFDRSVMIAPLWAITVLGMISRPIPTVLGIGLLKECQCTMLAGH